jgi:hypothetical protein
VPDGPQTPGARRSRRFNVRNETCLRIVVHASHILTLKRPESRAPTKSQRSFIPQPRVGPSRTCSPSSTSLCAGLATNARRAAFTPLHLSQRNMPPNFVHASHSLTLKRPEGRAPRACRCQQCWYVLPNLKRPKSNASLPEFVLAAERAFRRVARKLREEHAKSGLPLVLGDGDKVRYVYVKPRRRKQQ